MPQTPPSISGFGTAIQMSARPPTHFGPQTPLTFPAFEIICCCNSSHDSPDSTCLEINPRHRSARHSTAMPTAVISAISVSRATTLSSTLLAGTFPLWVLQLWGTWTADASSILPLPLSCPSPPAPFDMVAVSCLRGIANCIGEISCSCSCPSSDGCDIGGPGRGRDGCSALVCLKGMGITQAAGRVWGGRGGRCGYMLAVLDSQGGGSD